MAARMPRARARSDGTVSRVLRLLILFAEVDGPLGVHDIAKRSGLPISTVHRLVNLIADDGFIQYEAASRLYSLGPQMHRLTAMLWSSGPAVAAQPFLDKVSKRFDETVVALLYLPDQLAAIPVAKCDGTRALRYVFDMKVPLSLAWGASGKSILAHLSEDVIREAYATAEPSRSGLRLAPWSQYVKALHDIRQRGYAASSGERIPGARSVSSAVFGPRHEVVGAICVTFPQERLSSFSVEEFGAEVSSAARGLSLRLGAKPA